MQQKSDVHVFQGMQRDIDPHKHKPEYLVDAQNIRITTRGEDTEFAVISEKGSKKIIFEYPHYTKDGDGETIEGKYVGHCVLNQFIVLFTTTDELDYIHRIEKRSNGVYWLETLYRGHLGFSTDYRIDALGVYENEQIQKVYWTDGKNQPRVINIVSEKRENDLDSWDDYSFDFSQEIQWNDNYKTEVFKNFGGGMFPAGVIQYCYTYYNKYGQESNIVWQSPLYYIAFLDRGGSPEERVSCSFTVKVTDPDTRFDFIRLYSIIRTSLNAVPTCRRVMDVSLEEARSTKSVVIIDDGTVGDNIDPTELLYKGGEEVTAKTLSQKDGTLFLGNITITRPFLNPQNVPSPIETVSSTSRAIADYIELAGFYPSEYTLHLKGSDSTCTTPLTIKQGETYRLGLQFQYKNGKWSEPVFLGDYTYDNYSSVFVYNRLPNFSASFDFKPIYDLGYRRVRGVIVLPDINNRRIIAQGIVCPTVFNYKDRDSNSPYAQSSWFLRPYLSSVPTKILDHNDGDWTYDDGTETYAPSDISPQFYAFHTLFGGIDARAEIQGVPREAGNQVANLDADFKRYYSDSAYDTFNLHDHSTNSIFAVDPSILTFHSADLQFNEDIQSLDLSTAHFKVVGYVGDFSSAGDCMLQTSTPTTDSSGAGFVKNTFVMNQESTRTLGCYCGYEDGLIDDVSDSDQDLVTYDKGKAVKYYIYPWQRTGSINNDIPRQANKGTRTAVLKTKIWANIKVASTTYLWKNPIEYSSSIVKIFNFDQVGAVKLGSNIYYGNIDTMLNPILDYTPIWRYANHNYTVGKSGIQRLQNAGQYKSIESPFDKASHIGDKNDALRKNKFSVRMKYKSSIHGVIDINDVDVLRFYKDTYSSRDSNNTISYPYMILGELYREDAPSFGGTSESALQSNIWLPAGLDIKIETEEATLVTWDWGDCFQQRFDFLKTYAYTNEDENQVIEVGSFKGEFRVNADGRYDKNRGLTSNLAVSPQNFNLWNPVYNQSNNFFTYRILDSSYYDISNFPNQITWTKEHTSVADVDNWTQVTLASIVDLDGTKGEITAIRLFNDTLFVFQDRGISNILFNSRVQLNTTDGVPIEISNNYKVDGTRYVSDSIGCNNIDTICGTPSGIYFIDSSTRNLYNIGNGLSDISTNKSMSNWFKSYKFNKSSGNYQYLYYDFTNNDLYITNTGIGECLNYSEKLGSFVSFFDYDAAKVLVNVEDKFLGFVEDSGTLKMHELFSGSNTIFENPFPVSISFISNADSAINKIFTNVEMRADWRNSLSNLADGNGNSLGEFFDTIRVTNEYQDTDVKDLVNLVDRPSNLKNKFRVWRVNIPRDKTHKRDRISNPWCEISLTKKAENNNNPFILHDLSVQYYV